ncbi:uncharacterized protein I206_101029 [Kwoniella pini CBS 10737]|uniref:Uncharacterized protein n=1 Tax=Kwoniella pini CBS 10737 TaxID=1296096 RepID=A0A1B9IBS6_9TREE|nr:uncharacterized protein I206_00297 [Kwoniella pini CBS 10737]OCF52996.1 hypothetical protein I206_00297 [Kwoniella pini CBS 10737]
MSDQTLDRPMIFSDDPDFKTIEGWSRSNVEDDNDKLLPATTGFLTLLNDQNQKIRIDQLPIFSGQLSTNKINPDTVFGPEGQWGSKGKTVSDRFINMAGYYFATKDTIKGNIDKDKENQGLSIYVSFYVDTEKHYKINPKDSSPWLNFWTNDTASKFDTIELSLNLPKNKQWLNSALSAKGERHWIPSWRDTKDSLESIPGTVTSGKFSRAHQVKVGDSTDTDMCFNMKVEWEGTKLKDPDDGASLELLKDLFRGDTGLGVSCDVSITIKSQEL